MGDTESKAELSPLSHTWKNISSRMLGGSKENRFAQNPEPTRVSIKEMGVTVSLTLARELFPQFYKVKPQEGQIHSSTTSELYFAKSK